MERHLESHRWQFSLRALAIAVTVGCACFALWEASVPRLMTVMTFFSLACFAWIWNAYRSFIVASPVLGVAISWLMFGFWENYCNKQEYYIRVDLLFLMPFYALLTLVGSFYVIALLVDAHLTQPPDRRSD